MTEAGRYIKPVLHNLNPRRTAHYTGYHRFGHMFRWGVADLPSKRIVVTRGFAYGVTWLPAA